MKNIMKTAKNLMEKGDLVKNLEISIKKDIDSTTEILDLLEQRECIIINDKSLVKTPGLRYDFESRSTFVEKALNNWIQQLK